jgi:hypothetical protein
MPVAAEAALSIDSRHLGFSRITPRAFFAAKASFVRSLIMSAQMLSECSHHMDCRFDRHLASSSALFVVTLGLQERLRS